MEEFIAMGRELIGSVYFITLESSGESMIFQRGRQPWGRQPIIWPIFRENCMKMKKLWAGGARHLRPLDQPIPIFL